MGYFQNGLRQFNRKVIIAGNVMEMYEYEKPVIKGDKKKRLGRSAADFTTDDIKKENRGKTAQRARATVRRMANANPQLNKFFTITFAENMQDIRIAHYELDKFVKRLKTRHKNFAYICVIEFQKRGVIHFHLLCNLPYIDVNVLERLWGNGYVKINRLDNVDNVGAYITKYMTKDSIDERLIAKKCYTMSKNLKQPIAYTDEEEINEIMSSLENIKRVRSSEFETEYYGKVSYTQIVCTEQIRLPSIWEKIKKKARACLVPLPDGIISPFD